MAPARITQALNQSHVQNDLLNKYLKPEDPVRQRSPFQNRPNLDNQSYIYNKLNSELQNRLTNPIELDLNNPRMPPGLSQTDEPMLFHLKNGRGFDIDANRGVVDGYDNPLDVFQANHPTTSNTLLLASPKKVSRSLSNERKRHHDRDEEQTIQNFQINTRATRDRTSYAADAAKRGIIPRQNMPNREIKKAFLREKDKIKKEIDYIRQTMNYISKTNFPNFDFSNPRDPHWTSERPPTATDLKPGRAGTEVVNPEDYQRLKGLVGANLSSQRQFKGN
jgi:hypothetical protein